jgi:hypothetical protein
MNQSTLFRALCAAGVLATAGLAQATNFDAPTQAGEASTMTNGVPNAQTSNSPYGVSPNVYYVGPSPTTVMGAPGVVVAPVSRPGVTYEMGKASATTNVPGRGGEASTMTNGVPNMSTNNNAYVAGDAPTHVMGAPRETVAPMDTRKTYEMGRASATVNVPGRGGEASTMTNGVPNMSTNNN